VKYTLRGLLVTLLVTSPWAAAAAQEASDFDDIVATEELQEIASALGNEDIDSEFLADASSRILQIETGATACASSAGAELAGLDMRFEPLREITSDVTPELSRQRLEISEARDAALARQSRCQGVVVDAASLQARVAEERARLSQQFLSNRSQTVIQLVLNFPKRAATWPQKLRDSFALELVEGVDATAVLWLIVIVGFVATIVGLLLRHYFANWYQRAGGDSAPPQFKHLLLKPVAEFAPLWLIGVAFIFAFHYSIPDPTIDLLVYRIAWAIFLFGIGCVVINWATGPFSPSVEVSGLIPDHVGPLRLRLRILFLMITTSFVVLGGDWLSIRVSDDYVSGRASMIFLVGVAFVYLFSYLPNIPGIKGRFRLLRLVALVLTSLSILGVLAGYQNFAAFIIHGVTRTGIALFVLWILLWLVYIGFEYLIKTETPTATQVRATLGISSTGKGTGIGFMRLIADLVLWINFIVYMIYVWDESGSTLSTLYANFLIGWTFGGITLVPVNLISGILIFAGILILIGWLKRWIDRRWLQHIVIDRGARDAIITLFGYVGFVVAALVALAMAEVDLTGLAIVSGALAIGIGFGMQEIASNFVSGLILLFERPIRSGDFVTVGDVEGFVRSIRIRATEIETLDNQNVLVPNSELVSGRVTNWVLRDTHGRLQVRVGVAYGSDIETVRDILESVSREHPEVITDGRAPAPRALFMGFGDSSLDFELRVRVQRIERRFSVLSDLNFAIDAAFRQAGISIPFPQRDLHIVSYPGEEKTAPEHEHAHEKTAALVPAGTRAHTEEIEVAASVEDVWTAITSRDALKAWMIVDGQFAPYIGGAFEIALRDGTDIAGRIDVYLPNRRLRAVLLPDADEGPLPSGPITLEYALRRTDTCTIVTVTVAGIPDSEDWEEFYRLSVDRWSTGLDDLKTYLLGK
jgi:small-conductance mechanosensitive channel/uncharacterized protein YndB with AHSA1/START domain